MPVILVVRNLLRNDLGLRGLYVSGQIAEAIDSMARRVCGIATAIRVAGR